MCDSNWQQKWAEREAELECRVQELKEEHVRMEQEWSKEKQMMAEQRSSNSSVMKRYGHCCNVMAMIRQLPYRLQCEIAELERRGVERERELEKQRTDTLAQLIHQREENCTLQTSLDDMTSDLRKLVCYECYHGNTIVGCFQGQAGSAGQCRKRG